MAIRVTCPTCQHKFSIPDEYAGRRGKCPSCREVFQAPSAEESAAPAAPTKPTAPRVKKKPVRAGASPSTGKSSSEKSRSRGTVATKTRGETSSPAPPASGFTAAPAESVSERAKRSQKSRPKVKAPKWMVFGLLLLAVGGICAVVYVVTNDKDQVADKDISASNDENKKDAEENKKNSNEKQDSDEKKTTDPKADDEETDDEVDDGEDALPAETIKSAGALGAPKDYAKDVERAVVKIFAYKNGSSGGATGSGFVFDKRGWIATNHHVVKGADRVTVKFVGGPEWEIEGYLADSAEFDVAVIKLAKIPPAVKMLNLHPDAELPKGMAVVASGSPEGVDFVRTDGKVNAIKVTEQLPRQYTSNAGFKLYPGVYWIQHDALILPGNSGGPLMDENFDVIGINTWIDRKNNLRFSSRINHLYKLIRTIDEKVVKNFPVPGGEDVEDVIRDLTDKQLDANLKSAGDLIDQCKKQRWAASNKKEYEALKRLVEITIYHLPAIAKNIGYPAQQRKAAQDLIDRVTTELKKFSWDDITTDPDIANTNNQTVPLLPEPGETRLQSLFCFGKLIGKISWAKSNETGLIFQLIGTEARIVISTQEDVSDLESGSEYVIMGVTQGHVDVKSEERMQKMVLVSADQLIELNGF